MIDTLGAEALNLVDAKKTPRNPRSIILQFFCLWPERILLTAAFRASLQNANG